ncbi:hypothetical protein RSK20926_06682 [Roseobacter sp. SK209-2-6]|uniref:hypothetical protein n=1 Tax=Roseobacter sp. SK209-2-6 TaxID=388739 RepID=UPI0000F3D796|nr:hypothetical protein [Roseobacter sp. SK209-2-6]EBA17401.1 hypothetical protein RSK20926_06682 [Roseobacter sp. SK209-2-6]
MTKTNRQTTAALAVLILLQGVMLSALYAGIPPHPPEATPLFGIAPFIGAATAIALAAILVDPLASREGRWLSLLAAVLGLVSFGPQKFLDAQFGLIWPAVILGQLAAFVIVANLVKALRSQDAGAVQLSPEGGAA